MDEITQENSPVVLNLKVDDLSLTAIAKGNDKFECVVRDTADDLLGERKTSRAFTCTGQQLGAINMLMINGDDTPSSDHYYRVIGDLFKDFPNNLRPIP